MAVVCFTGDEFFFPKVDEADEEGLLIIGGKVDPARIIEAYKRGIFPWYNEDDFPMWWSPDPRFVLLPEQLHQSRSMQKVFARQAFVFKINTAFEEVVNACATVTRKDHDGTWITKEMQEAYTQLYHLGYGYCGEAWLGDELVGGVYGIKIGDVFFGESMFNKKTNASKFAFIHLVKYLQQSGVQLIDCQVHTTHVESLGAVFISRADFILLLKELAK